MYGQGDNEIAEARAYNPMTSDPLSERSPCGRGGEGNLIGGCGENVLEADGWCRHWHALGSVVCSLSVIASTVGAVVIRPVIIL